MKLMSKLTLTALLLAGVVGVSTLAGPATASAQDNNQDNKSQKAAPAEDRPAASGSYDYVAQPGDSYSVLARKAVQTYGFEEKVNLSQAQIVAAETNLTLAANSPLLIQGQKVSISKATVQEWVEKAEALTAVQQALWQPYTVGVNFDTSNNGE